LGHKEQKDEWTPRVVETFQRANVLPPNALVAAGSAYSAATAAGGQLYMWGRVKTTGDNWMYPKPVLDLRCDSLWLSTCLILKQKEFLCKSRLLDHVGCVELTLSCMLLNFMTGEKLY
jgi:hypothetical protein